jgi:hypothetical protein
MSIFPAHNFISRILQSKYFRDFFERRFYKSFFNKSTADKVKNGKRILIYAGIGDMYVSPIEMLFYHLLVQKGYDVDYCVYDETIEVNELITKERVESVGQKVFWDRSVVRAKMLLSAAKVNYNLIQLDAEAKLLVSQIPSTLDNYFSFHYNDIDFGDIVKGVMFRYYKSLTFDDDAIVVARKFLETSLSNYFKIQQLTSNKEYEFVLFSHGIYCTWQPIVEFCSRNKINYVCYDRAKTKAHCNFNLNVPSPVWDISAAWQRLSDYKLTAEEGKRVDDYLKERELQTGDVYSYNFSARENDLKAVRSQLGISPNAKVVTIFTNLIWDAANVSRDIAFSSPLECIKAIVAQYQNTDDTHIVVRSHPAEKVLGTKERYGKLVRESFKELPANVTIIEPEDNINSFTVLELSDVGIVHTSTVGLEMAIEGKPVILISDTHYRGKGFTHDVSSSEDFFTKLDNLLAGKDKLPNQVILARKYFYLMMFEYQHKMPMTFTAKNVFNGYGYDSFEDLANDANAPINKIVKTITTQEDILDFVFK